MQSWLIAGHRGGVGRTSFTLDLGAALVAAGKRVLLLDGDPVRPVARRTGLEVAANADAISHIEAGLEVATAANRSALPKLIFETGRDYDVVLLDGPAGWVPRDAELLGMVDEILVHLRADPLSWSTLPGWFRSLQAAAKTVAGGKIRGFAVGAPPDTVDDACLQAALGLLGESCLGPVLPWSTDVARAEGELSTVRGSCSESGYVTACVALSQRLLRAA